MNNKIFKIFLFFLVSNCLEAQNPAIKIYVADAENSKNISNAKVCLEGFEIPAIKAQYNKKEKYYYFTEIPKNYNTVMVYHKKYNEKGFQDINGLPKELKFKLHEPLQNYYDFDYFTEDKTISKKYFYSIDDPFKLILCIKKEGDKHISTANYTKDRNTIKEFLANNNDIELINPLLPMEMQGKIEAYPSFSKNFSLKEIRDKNIYGYPFPLYDGHSSEWFEGNNYGYRRKYVNSIIFIVRKKNGTRFKRFNDPIIKKINTYKPIYFQLITYNKYNSESFNKSYDQLNKKMNHNIDSSKVFFYRTDIELFERKYYKNYLYEPEVESKPNIFNMTETLEKPFFTSYIDFDKFIDDYTTDGLYYYYKMNERLLQSYYKEVKKITPDYSSIGLGILDMYEYYYNENINIKP